MSAERNRILEEKLARCEAISRWASQLRKTYSIDEMIDRVKARMQVADAGDGESLTFELKMLLTEAGTWDPSRYDEALQLIDGMIEQKPDDVRYPLSKASLYFYSLKDPETALRCVDFALDRARRTKFFLREALGVKARILLELARGEELGQVLEQIMSVDTYEEIPDIGRERDFVDRAPHGLIAPDIVVRYNRYYPVTQRWQARRDWLDELRAELPLASMIERVQSRVEAADDEEDKSELAFSLGRLCTEEKRYDEALRWFDHARDWDPDDARPAIRKAIVLLVNFDDAGRAMIAIEPAIHRAFRIRAFRRMALGVKARILLKLDRGSELAPVLKQIMSLDRLPEDFDIGRERDFVDDAPPGVVPKDILTRYDEFCPRVPLD